MKAVDVAKDLIFLMDIYNIGNENTPKGKNVELSNTKLQKIMYIVMGVALKVDMIPKTSVLNNEGKVVLSLFDELPEAWPYGPVFKNIYQNYSQLTTEAFSVNYKPFYEVKEGKSISRQRDEEIMKYILQEFIASNIPKKKALELSNWSHQDGSPWKFVCDKYNTFGCKIESFLIKGYFDKLKKEDLFGLDIDKIYAKAEEIRKKYITKYLELQLNLDKTTNHL
jgi:uncharacterized phage-associated protein